MGIEMGCVTQSKESRKWAREESNEGSREYSKIIERERENKYPKNDGWCKVSFQAESIVAQIMGSAKITKKKREVK